MKVQEALFKGINLLKEKHIDEAGLKARILLSSILNLRREELIIKMENELKSKDEENFFYGIDKISKGYPVEYITHSKEFMKLNFFIDEGVLVPRNDTEILVEEIINICKEEKKREILELCTGSGIIAISLAQYLENVKIIGTDISDKALEIARKNLNNLKQTDKVKLIKSNMFDKIDKKFDIIVSNPPYIKTEVIKEYILQYEPQIALDGGNDGLKFYKIIIEEGYKYLRNNGIIALEIGYDQKKEVISIAKQTKKYDNIRCIKDLGGNDRVIIMEYKEV